MMSEYRVFNKAILLTVKTKRPEKWLLIDRETGEVYQGSPGGWWDKMKPYNKDDVGDDSPKLF
jgi:hypothetical protein